MGHTITGSLSPQGRGNRINTHRDLIFYPTIEPALVCEANQQVVLRDNEYLITWHRVLPGVIQIVF
jgi:hypothetical protein